MSASDIAIKGAREHNLRSVDLVLPRNQLICLTGVSGSGKSSLAFDTLYAEGQRRYIESLSSYARQFLGQMPKPDVDLITGISPSISISQKSAGNNPRSTVGTITEIYDFLRVLYARVGEQHCDRCGRVVEAQSRDQIINRILQFPAGSRIAILAPLVRGQKGHYKDLFASLHKQGFARARVDGQIVALTDDLQLDRQMRHTIEVVVDRFEIGPDTRDRLSESIDIALKQGAGNLIVQTLDSAPDRGGVHAPDGVAQAAMERADVLFSAHYACAACSRSFQPPSPQLFSFNGPHGMCPACSGLGERFTFDLERLIPDPRKSMEAGAIKLFSPKKGINTWMVHQIVIIARFFEKMFRLPENSLWNTPWQELPEELRRILLYGQDGLLIPLEASPYPKDYALEYKGIIAQLHARHEFSPKAQTKEIEAYMGMLTCPTCQGDRLNSQARCVMITTATGDFEPRAASLPALCGMTIDRARQFFERLDLDATGQLIAQELLKEIRGRLELLIDVGLEYLTLNRQAPTLSGGESQRIRLAGQVGCGLVGVVYILDEPSIGLHPRDNQRLLQTMQRLRDLGNTVVVVEHDEETMRAADMIVDFGPGAGIRGGEIVAQGNANVLAKESRSLTGQFLAGKETIDVPQSRRPTGDKWLTVSGASHNNLKNVDVRIPLGAFVCITGVSGSGKSSFVNGILSQILLRDLNGGDGNPGPFNNIQGLEHLDKLIAIDQSPIGRTPRSNPGTYIKLFDEIRKLFTQLPDAKRRGFAPGRFSFNVNGGRCEACEGNGSTKLEMDFLADIWVTCPVCQGHRFNRETLAVRYKDKSIADILEMDTQQLLDLFQNIPAIHRKLRTLHDVGLDYIKLGQPSPTLSGGEAQRIKLARELVKRSTGRTIYLLDEPTTGLHFADVRLLLRVLHSFADAGNTVVVVEHNLDVIKTADWIIDLGPEGGAAGGKIVCAGTPEDLAKCQESHTGRALMPVLRPARRSANAKKQGAPRKNAEVQLATHIDVRDATQHNLRNVSVRIPRDQMTVFSGPSGSGKSSLAMDTIYAEGQRRYVESLSAYARQFVGQMQKPRVEQIEGLSPAIAIQQQNLGNSPRSTVGTTTEIHDYLRVFMARLGTLHCPQCGIAVGTQTPDEIVDKVLQLEPQTRVLLMAPIEVEVGRGYESLWQELRNGGYVRVRVDGVTYSLDDPPNIDRRRRHQTEVIVDRTIIRREDRTRIAESIESALSLGNGVLHVAIASETIPEERWTVHVHSQHRVCPSCQRSFTALTPHHFSFNSPLGWCPGCEGLGQQSGTNLEALIVDPRQSLSQGVLRSWPELDKQVSQRMLVTLANDNGIPLELPWQDLDPRHRRILLHGTGDRWYSIFSERNSSPSNAGPLLFRFQYKGVYPALNEAAKLSPFLRVRLQQLVDMVECSACDGSRLRDDAAAVRFRDRTMDQLCRMPLRGLLGEIRSWKLSEREQKIAGELMVQIENRLAFLNDVGLEYLTLARPAGSLSGGEAQRIRLASQLGSALCGVLYVLDEPTIGLHPRDNQRLLAALHKLRDLGNTLLIVEHDREIIAGSDRVVDFGPGAGRFGGQIVAEAPPAEIGQQSSSVTGPYITGTKSISIPTNRRAATAFLQVEGARHHNLQNIDVAIPLGVLTAVTGPSGSGKSSLIDDTLYAVLARSLHRAQTQPGAHSRIVGIEQINKVIRVDQHPLGNTPASTPATYTGLFEEIRELFARQPEAIRRGFNVRRFSFNAPGGRCEACEGNGQRCIEMHFLPDVWVSCEHCHGRRYNAETLAVMYQGRSIADVLEMTCSEAYALFKDVPKVNRILEILCDVGLDYLPIGQPAPTLSGGEAQRVKLAAELARPFTGRTLYLLDEPTTGLHFEDIGKLLRVLHRLVDAGNSVVVIEHNLDVIKSADWIIDMGPEAGDGGGQVVVCGTPEDVAAFAEKQTKTTGNGRKPKTPSVPRMRCYTGEALVPVLAAGPYAERPVFQSAPQPVATVATDGRLMPGSSVLFAAAELDEVTNSDGPNYMKQRMPWEILGKTWHLARNGFPPGSHIVWDQGILEEFFKRLQREQPDLKYHWTEQFVVRVGIPKIDVAWAGIFTKRPSGIDLSLYGPKSQFSLQELSELGDVTLTQENTSVDIIRIRFQQYHEIRAPQFWQFLKLHRQSVVLRTLPQSSHE